MYNICIYKYSRNIFCNQQIVCNEVTLGSEMAFIRKINSTLVELIIMFYVCRAKKYL